MRSRRSAGQARSASSGVRRGFTLLEALVALVIVTAACVVTMQALSGGLRAALRVGRHVEAVSLAEAGMAELSLVPADSLPGYAKVRERRFPSPLERFRSRAQLRRLPGSPDLVGASVAIAWDGGEYTLESVFYRPLRLAGAAATASARP